MTLKREDDVIHTVFEDDHSLTIVRVWDNGDVELFRVDLRTPAGIKDIDSTHTTLKDAVYRYNELVRRITRVQ